MPLTAARWLASAKLNRIIGTLAAKLDIERPLTFLNRLPLVPAFDDELTGRFTGRVMAADLIADDQRAVVQESLQIEVTTDVIPNIKIGQRLGQRLLTRLKQMESGAMTVAGENALRDWDSALAENLLLGVRQRMNALACAMMLDAATYDRWGIKLTGASWGMPADLKVTPATAWTVAATATPINDILGVDQVASLKYGVTYDVVTMPTQNFRDMVATTEFANKASLFMGGTAFMLTPAALKTKSDAEMKDLAQRMLGKAFVLDDHQYYTRANDGTQPATRTMPLNKVLLSRSADEGDGTVMDMANSVPTESIVADLVATAPDGIGGEQYGPIAYYTPESFDLNQPGVVAWAVARAFPRKFVPEATAVLTVG